MRVFSLKCELKIFLWNFVFVQLQKEELFINFILSKLMTWTFPIHDFIRTIQLNVETPFDIVYQVTLFNFFIFL